MKKTILARAFAGLLMGAMALGGAAAATLVAAPTTAVAAEQTQVMPDGVKATVLSLESDSVTPIKITRPGSYVLKTAEDETTPIMGYTIDVPNASEINPVRIYIDGTVYVSRSENSRVSKRKWLFNIKQGSNIEFVGVNDPCVSFKDKSAYHQAASGFLTDRYYDGNSSYKNAESDISVSLKVGDDSENFLLWYSQLLDQAVPAISLGNTTGKLVADFKNLRIRDYTGKSGLWLSGNGIYEYAVPVRLFRASYDNGTNQGNRNPLNATFTDCVFYDTSGDHNGAVSVVGDSNDNDATSNLTATFNNCEFSGHYDEGVWQTSKSYTSVEETKEFAMMNAGGKYAVAGVMGVTNATVNLNNTRMANFHSTRSTSEDCTMTVDALNVARSARCNINGGTITRYGAQGNTCVMYAAGILTLDGSTEIASFWKNSHAGSTNEGDNYTEADIATGTAKSLYIPKKTSDEAPYLNIASGFSARGGFGDHVWISVEETADDPSALARVLGTCESDKIEGVVPDGSSENDGNSDKYEIVNLNGELIFRKTVHTHKWLVETYDLGVKAYCVGPFNNGECEYGMDENGEPKKHLLATYTLSMTTKAPAIQQGELVYDGRPIQISMDKYSQQYMEQMGVTAGDITWYSCKSQEDAEAYQNGTKLDGAPTDAGNYYVVATFKTASGSPNYGKTIESKRAFSIAPRRLVKNNYDGFKFTLKDGGKGAGKYAYDTKGHQPVIEDATYTNGADDVITLVEGVDFELGSMDGPELKQTEPGKYKCVVIGKGNFMTKTGTTASLTLSWEILDVGRFDLEVLGYEGIYDGEQHGITVTVKNDPAPDDLKIEYKTSDGDWSTENPTFKNAVTRTVWYRVTATDYLTVTGKQTVEISKADQEAPTGLVGNDWTTCSSRDGSIAGVTKAMEYRYGNGETYAAVGTDGTLGGLASGTYYVRYAADYNHNESPECKVSISRGPHAVADGAKWKQAEPGWHYKSCKYCGEVAERGSCRWEYEIITPATPEADGTRQKVCRICGIKDFYTGVESYTYKDTYAPVIYDVWWDSSYCESVTFDVIDDRDETVTVTDNGQVLQPDQDGRYTVRAAEGDAGAAHVIVATDAAGNSSTETIKMYAEHDYDWVIDKTPTPVAPGSKHGTCKVCGHESGAVEIPAVGITGYSDVYDGGEHGVTVDKDEVSSIGFRVKGSDGWSAESPVIKNVGSIIVEFKATLASGEECEGEVTLEVTPRPVTVRASDAKKAYGDKDPELGYEVTAGTLADGESLEGVAVSREPGEGVREGGYAITASQAEGANANYEIEFEPGTFTIERRVVTVTWEVGNYVYNGFGQGPYATAQNVLDGDGLSLRVSNNGAIDAGSYTASVTGLAGTAAGNYALPAEGLTCDYEILRASQDVPEVQAAAETVSGKKDGAITGVDSTMEWRADSSPEYTSVGSVSQVDSLAAGKYYVRRKATANYEASAEVEVTIAAGRRLTAKLPQDQTGYRLEAQAADYGWHDTARFTISIEDGYFTDPASFSVKVNGKAVEVSAAGEFFVEDVEDDLTVSVEGVRKHEAASDKWEFDATSHWHLCTCGEKIDEAEHDFAWIVDKKPTATEAGSKHQECATCGYKLDVIEIPAASVGDYSDIYDGKSHTVDTSNLPEGAMAEYSTDGGKTWSSEAPAIKNVGTLNAKYRVSLDGAQIEGEVTLEVMPRPVTVRASDAKKTYGDKDPELGYEITAGALADGESLEGVAVSRESGEGVREGGYAITASQAEGANANYRVTFRPGAFTIERRAVTVTWGTTEFIYDGNAKSPEIALGNVLEGDDVHVSVSVEGQAKDVGDGYKASISSLMGADANNYTLPADGLTCNFSIKKAAQGAPVVQPCAETVSGKKDGAIEGVTTRMEWRARGEQFFRTVVEDGKLSDLAAGTYEVRYVATANHEASPVTEVTVAEGRKLVVALPATQVGYSVTAEPSELGWHQSSKLVFALADGYYKTTDFVIEVNGEKIELADDGTYGLPKLEGDVFVTIKGVAKHGPDGSGWKSDETSHWHICTCGEQIDKAGHDFEWQTVVAATVSSKGLRQQVCKVCGAEGATEETPMLDPAPSDPSASGAPAAPTKPSADQQPSASAKKTEVPDCGDDSVSQRLALTCVLLGISLVAAFAAFRRRTA